MKVLLTGAQGQLGRALQPVLAGHELQAHDSHSLDVTNEAVIENAIATFKPDVVVNAAAYTAVDKAESDLESADRVNNKAVASLARACGQQQSRLIHVSTDFVFSGQKSTPYTVQDTCDPVGVYGKTKRQGEMAVLKHLPQSGTIIRTAWLYSAYGNNFVKTMLRVMAQRSEIKVVYDQVGTPTCVGGLADLIGRACENPEAHGVLHWSDAGVASWFDFAVAIYEEARALGLLTSAVNILPIPSSEYPTPAKRPSFSVLDKSESYQQYSMPIVHWRVQLRQVLSEIAAQNGGI
jgi:dTDP-4-dehydrorhamnose reductase